MCTAGVNGGSGTTTRASLLKMVMPAEQTMKSDMLTARWHAFWLAWREGEGRSGNRKGEEQRSRGRGGGGDGARGVAYLGVAWRAA